MTLFSGINAEIRAELFQGIARENRRITLDVVGDEYEVESALAGGRSRVGGLLVELSARAVERMDVGFFGYTSSPLVLLVHLYYSLYTSGQLFFLLHLHLYLKIAQDN